MRRFIERLKSYFLRKAAGDFAACLIIGAALFLAPGVLVWAFDLNTVWLGKVWEQVLPYLPVTLQLASDVAEKAHQFLLAGFNFTNGLLEEEADAAAQLEAGARIYLIGEAWVLKIQVSFILRTLYRVSVG